MMRSAERGFAPGESDFAVTNTRYILGGACVLLLFGLASLFSIDYARESGFFLKQGIFVVLGLVPLLLFWRIPGEFWQRASVVIYVLNLLLLVGVLVKGQEAGGAQRWLQIGPLQFQPSEYSKVAIALTLSAFYANRIEEIKKPKTFLLSLAHLAPPLLLVFKQPHLGGTLTLIAIWAAVTVVSGVPWKFIGLAALCGLALAVVAWNAPGVLTKEQKSRVVGFMNPDPKGDAYQQTRGLVALGSGGTFGTGYLKGKLKANGSVPEQQTDFIFSVIGEEGGLFGVLILLATYCFFFYRCWLACQACIDQYLALAGTGVLAALAFHFVANVGMNLMVLPVVGLWLPFLSYGGTAVWMCLAAVGFFAGMGRSS